MESKQQDKIGTFKADITTNAFWGSPLMTIDNICLIKQGSVLTSVKLLQFIES